MPLRASDGKLLTAKFKLVKGRDDECCCQTDVTCCGGQCVAPCCRVIVRFTISPECATKEGSCSGFNYDTFESYSYPATGEEDCQCQSDPFFGEICDFYSESAQTFIDIDVTDSFGGLTESETDGDICFAYLTFPSGGRAASEFHFTNRVDSQWLTLGNWFRDKNFTRPAGSLPGPADKITLWATAVLPGGMRLNNTAGAFTVNEIVLAANGGIKGALTTKKLFALGGQIPAGGQINVTQSVDAKDITIAGQLILQESASALFWGASKITTDGKVINDGVGRVVFRDTSFNDGELESRLGVQIAFRNEAVNNGTITGGFTRFVGAAENNGTITPTNTFGSAAETIFSGSAKNNGDIDGTAGFSFIPELAVIDEETNTYIKAGNYGTITKKAGFYNGAVNYGTVNGTASFAFGDNYGTVGSAVFFTNITSGPAGFSGGRANNYGTVRTVANFIGRLDVLTGVAEGAINRPSGCVGQKAWFDSVSANLGRPNPNDAPATGGNRVYECDTADCCGEETIKMSIKRAAFTDEEESNEDEADEDEPIDSIGVDYTEEDLVDDLTCEEALLDCRMDLRVSGSCRQIRTCHYGANESDSPPAGECGVNCFYELKIKKGVTSDGRPIYDYIGFADPLICAGVTNIELIQQCPGGYESNMAPGGTCRQNLTEDQCFARGGGTATKNTQTTSERAKCADRPCDVCCGPAICSPLFVGQDGSNSITTEECTRCENVCVDMTGAEREVSAGFECDPCYNSEGRCYGFNYDTYESYSYPASGPEDCQCIEDEWWGEICDYYDVVCDAETFVTRGFCGVVIPGTDGVLQELGICASSFFSRRSHRCDFEEFPMVLCAGGSFITDAFGYPQALPHAGSGFMLAGGGVDSFPGGAFGWGYSVGLNIGQAVSVTPTSCGGWAFSALQDGRGGMFAPILAVGGEIKTITECGVCFPESISVSGEGSKWVTTNESTGEGARVFFTVSNETVTITEGYRCFGGYFQSAPVYFASCVPCAEVDATDAPRGFIPPPIEFLTRLPQTAAENTSEESSMTPASAEKYPPPPDTQNLKPIIVPDDQIPAHLSTTLTAVRTAHPDKIIKVQRFFGGKYGFVAEQIAQGRPISSLKAAEPKDCLYPLEDTTGTGTFLATMLEKIGIKSSPNCACKTRARVMNCRGPEWCAGNIDKIVGWLREEATKRKLPFVDLAGKLLVKRAISLARAAKKKEKTDGITAPHSTDS